jgi:hypothetical protein
MTAAKANGASTTYYTPAWVIHSLDNQLERDPEERAAAFEHSGRVKSNVALRGVPAKGNKTAGGQGTLWPDNQPHRHMLGHVNCDTL